MLSLTNILHRSGQLDAAILANDMALEASPRVVALHFNMANLYAARGDTVHRTDAMRRTAAFLSEFAPNLEDSRGDEKDAGEREMDAALRTLRDAMRLTAGDDAIRGDWGRATRFYEASLGLQASLQPAKERLHAIRCDKVLSNPHIYRNPK